jgi:hypothetical protein
MAKEEAINGDISIFGGCSIKRSARLLMSFNENEEYPKLKQPGRKL